MRISVVRLLLTSCASIALAVAPAQASDPSLLELQLEMLSQGQGLNPTPEKRSELLWVLEQLIGMVCMKPLLTSTEYVPKDLDPKCQGYIDQMKILDPTNPTGICAETGIDSDLCKDAVDTQHTGVLVVIPNFRQSTRLPNEVSSLELKQKLENSASQREIGTLTTTATAKQQQYLKKNSLQLFDEITEAYKSAIQLACRSSRSSFQAETSTSLVKSVDKGPKIVRTWQRTSLCSQTIDLALTFDRKMPVAICARDGYFTPNCTIARRERLKIRPKWEAAAKAQVEKSGPIKQQQKPSGTPTPAEKPFVAF